jgi:hypothetical protein
MPDGSAPDGPPDPFGPLAADAARLHEVFVSFQRAGFNASEALYLVACALAGGPKATP